MPSVPKWDAPRDAVDEALAMNMSHAYWKRAQKERPVMTCGEMGFSSWKSSVEYYLLPFEYEKYDSYYVVRPHVVDYDWRLVRGFIVYLFQPPELSLLIGIVPSK